MSHVSGDAFSVSVDIRGVDHLTHRMDSIAGRLIPTMVKTIQWALYNRGAIPAVKVSVAQRSGIGHTIWGANPSGLDKIVNAGRAVIGQDRGQTSLLMKGIPAMLEDGGRIAPHQIRNAFGHRGRRIPHPGMTLRAHGFGRSALEGSRSAITKAVDEAVARMIEATASVE